LIVGIQQDDNTQICTQILLQSRAITWNANNNFHLMSAMLLLLLLLL